MITTMAGASGLCTNLCLDSANSVCDDGGAGSQYSTCDYGSDCHDCGPRNAPPPPPGCWVTHTCIYEDGGDVFAYVLLGIFGAFFLCIQVGLIWNIRKRRAFDREMLLEQQRRNANHGVTMELATDQGNPVDLEQTERLRATVQRRAEMEAAEAEARAALAKAEEERLAREAGADDAPPQRFTDWTVAQTEIAGPGGRPMDAWKVQEMMSALTSAGLSADASRGLTSRTSSSS